MQKNLLLYFLLLFYNISTAQTWQTVGQSNFAQPSWQTQINIIKGIPIMGCASPYSASAYQFYNLNWNILGALNFAPSAVGQMTMDSDSINPYMAFRDGAQQNKVSDMKFNGTKWNYFGNAGFSAVEATESNIQLDDSFTPYVCYKEEDAWPYGLSVKKYINNNWEQVGERNFTVIPAIKSDFTINNQNKLYISYINDYANNQYPEVRKFSDTG